MLKSIVTSLHDLIRKILKKKKLYAYTNYLFNSDGLITKHNFDFLKKKKFISAYKKSSNLRMQWRFHVIGWAANYAKKIKNGSSADFVECGVHTGNTASFAFFYSQLFKTNKKFYLLDTYTGLVKNLISNAEKKEWKKNKKDPSKHYNADVEKIIRKKFQKYSNVKIIKGIIPNVFKKLKIKKISYLHIDLNCAIPEIEALKFFWPKIIKGGIIISDDYGWSNHIVQKKNGMSL